MTGLANPLAIGSLALTALSTREKAADFLKNNWPWIVGIGVAGVGIYLVYDKWFADKSKPQITEDPKYPSSSLTKQEAKTIAEELFEAMRTSGTDHQRIFDALQDLTYNDFVKVSNEFGMRYYFNVTGEESVSWFPGSENLSLQEWLRRELTAKEMQVVQQIMPNVITKARPVKVGSNVAAAKDGLTVHEAVKNGNIWTKEGVEGTFQKAEKIGEVSEIITDGNGKQFAIIDQGWFSWTDVMVEVENLIVL